MGLKDDGERMVPQHHKGKNFYGAHVSRYTAALPVVEGKTVLDIASGSGYGTKILSGSARNVYGVDVSSSAVKYAQKHFAASNIDYKLGDGKKIPMEDNSVDVVTSFETIEHVDDYRLFLREIKRVLRPGGVLLLSTPNESEYPKGNHFHVHEFGYAELKKELAACFKNINGYHQTYWLCSTILSAELQKSEWDMDLRTITTSTAGEDATLYFFMVCGDGALPDIGPMCTIGEHFRPIAAQQERNREQQEIAKLKAAADQADRELMTAIDELRALRSSKAWKVARSLQVIKAKLTRSE